MTNDPIEKLFEGLTPEEEHKLAKQVAGTDRPKPKVSEAEMRQWIYATARSLADSGLTLEEYNEITKKVCDNFGPRNAGFV